MKLTFWELAFWELTFWEVDILGVDMLGVDILRLTLNDIANLQLDSKTELNEDQQPI